MRAGLHEDIQTKQFSIECWHVVHHVMEQYDTVCTSLFVLGKNVIFSTF